MTEKKPSRASFNDSARPVTMTEGLDLATNSARPITMSGGGEGASVRPATTGESGAGPKPPKPTK